MLITNDRMRDHKLELLEMKLFRRWSSGHIVNYNFMAFVDDERRDHEAKADNDNYNYDWMGNDNGDIGFRPADFFSREIQANEGEGGSTVWHIPVEDWEENERFCVRIPRR